MNEQNPSQEAVEPAEDDDVEGHRFLPDLMGDDSGVPHNSADNRPGVPQKGDDVEGHVMPSSFRPDEEEMFGDKDRHN